MPPTQDTCKLQECSQVLSISSIACPYCRDVPISDYNGTQSSHVYCCEQHLLLDVDNHKARCVRRQIWRTIGRAGQLCNMIFMCERMALSIQRIVAEVQGSGNKRHIWMENMAEGKSLLPEHWWQLSFEGRLSAMSFEQCVYATQLLRPLLAWLLKGTNTHIQVVDFVPKGYGEVHMAFKMGADWVWRTPSLMHTVLLLRSPSSRDALIIDTTSMQYMEPVRCTQNLQYYAKNSHYLLGDSSDKHYRKPVTANHVVPLKPWEFVFEIGSRTMHNEVVQLINRLGGRRVLFDMGDVEFWGVALEIERAVYKSLRNLRPIVEKTIFRNYHSVVISELLMNCDGLGHEEVMEAFEECRKNDDHAR